MSIIELDRRAMNVTAGIIPLSTPEQLDNPTPCERWLLRDLLGHIIGQYHGSLRPPRVSRRAWRRSALAG